jgi:hypothetical protein
MPADAPDNLSRLRRAIGEVLNDVDALGTTHGERGEYGYEAEIVRVGLRDAHSLNEVEAVLRRAFQSVADSVLDEAAYAEAARRIWALRRPS